MYSAAGHSAWRGFVGSERSSRASIVAMLSSAEVHFLTSSRCQRRRVAGVTRKATGRSRGMARLAAARRTCVDGPELAWARRPLQHPELMAENEDCLLYTSDAADDLTRVDLGGRRIIKKKKINT